MSYYDHGTSMVLELGVWSDGQSLRQSECRSWMLEKEVAERRAEKQIGFESVFMRILVDFLSQRRTHQK